jgi:hypothetical protein
MAGTVELARPSRRGQDVYGCELSDDAMRRVSGGTGPAPRDPASGLPTGQRMHKPYGLGR